MNRPSPPVQWLPLAVLLCIAGSTAFAFAEPVAVMAAVTGRVEVTPARSRTALRAAFGRALERGDRVAVSPGGSATLFFNDGNVIELAERSAITIGGKVAASARGGAIPSDVFARVSQFATGGSRQTGLVAMSEMRQSAATSTALLMEPRRSTVLEAAPVFVWRAITGATRYRVAVRSAAGDSLWAQELAATGSGEAVSAAYPAGATPLPAGDELEWEVEALDERGSLRREASTCRVLLADERENVRADLARISQAAGGEQAAAACFLAGSYLSERGLLDAAAEQFRALALLAPEAAAPHEALGDLYLRMGLTERAAAEYQQALSLQRELR